MRLIRFSSCFRDGLFSALIFRETADRGRRERDAGPSAPAQHDIARVYHVADVRVWSNAFFLP